MRGLAEFLTESDTEVFIYTQSYPDLEKEGLEKLPEAIVFYSKYMEAAMSNPFSVIRHKTKFSSFLLEHKIDLVLANNHNSLAWIKAGQRVDIPVIYGCHGVGLMCSLQIRYLKPDKSLCSLPSVVDCHNCFWGIRKTSTKHLKDILAEILFFTWRSKPKPNYWRYYQSRKIINSATGRLGNSKLTVSLFDNQKNSIGYPLPVNASDKHKSNWYRPQVNEQLLAQYKLEYKNFILCSGRIHEIKGQLYAVEALQYLNGQQVLVLTGADIDNPNSSVSRTYLQIIKDRISELDLGKRVVFTNTLDQPELVTLYSAARINLMPSIWLETFGLVAIEAMACGTPSIVTRNSGASECITQETGRIIERMNSQAIANSVKEIWDNAIEMGKQAREHILQNYDWKTNGRKYLDLFKAVSSRL